MEGDGGSMKPMEEVLLIGESELDRLVLVDREKPEVDSREKGKHTARNKERSVIRWASGSGNRIQTFCIHTN